MSADHVKKDRRVVFAVGLALIVVAAIFSLWFLFLVRPNNAPAPENTLLAPPGQVVDVHTNHHEVFRRAFWRHPSPADQILHAERRQWRDVTETDAVQRWQWFLAVYPSDELLAHLRNPETLGLHPLASPAPWTDQSAPPPPWFPLHADDSLQVLQNASTGLTLLYRAKDNLLYATDRGQGFAAATAINATR